MIYLLYGENAFEKRQKLQKLISDAEVIRYEGDELDASVLSDILYGQTLFSSMRTVVISHFSNNEELWRLLPELAKRPAETKVILLEEKIDKRTKTYKWLKKYAQTQEFEPLNERQKTQLINWCMRRATSLNFTLSYTQTEKLIDRLGYDQMRLDNVICQLALAGAVTDQTIDKMVPLAKTENVFDLFRATLSGDRNRIRDIVAYLELTDGDDGAYQVLGLLSSQLMNVAALVLGEGDNQVVAKDFSAHPYMLGKLNKLANQVDKQKLRYITQVLFEADEKMKTANLKPWIILETALVKISLTI